MKNFNKKEANMRTISNAEIAKKLYSNEKIASHFSFDEILDEVDKCRSVEEEAKKCDVEKIVDNFRFGFLERIYWEEYEKQTK